MFVLSLAFGCGPSRDRQEPSTVFLNQAPEVEYVGLQACRSCHLEQFTTFRNTGMGRAFYPMSPEIAVEDFTINNVFVANDSGLHYRMERCGEKFYQRQYLLDSAGREIAVDEREMAFVSKSKVDFHIAVRQAIYGSSSRLCLARSYKMFLGMITIRSALPCITSTNPKPEYSPRAPLYWPQLAVRLL